MFGRHVTVCSTWLHFDYSLDGNNLIGSFFLSLSPPTPHLFPSPLLLSFSSSLHLSVSSFTSLSLPQKHSPSGTIELKEIRSISDILDDGTFQVSSLSLSLSLSLIRMLQVL